MNITFPHMGELNIFLKTILQGMGHKVIVPPVNSNRTLELGVKYSPETVCLPFKLSLGNFIEALDAGADTILTCGGSGPCRLGYYAAIQKNILQDLGYKFNMLVAEPNIKESVRLFSALTSLRNIPATVRIFNLAYRQMLRLDELKKKYIAISARAYDAKEPEIIWQKAIRIIAQTQTAKEVDEYFYKAWEDLVAIRQNNIYPLQIGLCGEIYVMLESYVNKEIEKKLINMGVEVHKNNSLSNYVQVHLLHNPAYCKQYQQTIAAAKPYLCHAVGGHARESVGSMVQMGKEQLDGIIHVLPFTCMPEVIAKSIMPKVSKDMGVPLLSLTFDEHAAETGLITRLEAFVDLLHYRRTKCSNVADN